MVGAAFDRSCLAVQAAGHSWTASSLCHVRPGSLRCLPFVTGSPACREGRYNLSEDLKFWATPPYHGSLMEVRCLCCRR